MTNAILRPFEKLFNRVKGGVYCVLSPFSPSVQKKQEVHRWRKRRKEIIENHPGQVLDSEALKELINCALQESRHRGYEHDLVVLTPPQYSSFVDIPATMTIEQAQRSGSTWARDASTRLSSHGWDQDVYVTYSDTVDRAVLIDSSEMETQDLSDWSPNQ